MATIHIRRQTWENLGQRLDRISMCNARERLGSLKESLLSSKPKQMEECLTKTTVSFWQLYGQVCNWGWRLCWTRALGARVMSLLVLVATGVGLGLWSWTAPTAGWTSTTWKRHQARSTWRQTDNVNQFLLQDWLGNDSPSAAAFRGHRCPASLSFCQAMPLLSFPLNSKVPTTTREIVSFKGCPFDFYNFFFLSLGSPVEAHPHCCDLASSTQSPSLVSLYEILALVLKILLYVCP